jgi:DNA polymerase I-like protein with 3'-5' exonuclease and polymerase domains
VVDLKIINNIQEVEDLLVREHLVALTALLILNHRIIVGFYITSGDQGYMEVSEVEFNQLGRLLFQPTRTRIAVYGLKRIWEELEVPGIDASDLNLHLIIDTKLMAYLLNPDAGREEPEGLSRSHLAHEYLNEDYPHMAVEVRDRGYPEAFRDALVRDARTIFRLAEVLPTRMDRDLYNLYQRLELPLMQVLDSMHQTGIGIDEFRAEQELQQLRKEMHLLEGRITDGVPVDFLLIRNYLNS